MADTQALLERLRAMAQLPAVYGRNFDEPIIEAADTIDSLLRQLAMKDEALRKSLARLEAHPDRLTLDIEAIGLARAALKDADEQEIARRFCMGPPPAGVRSVWPDENGNLVDTTPAESERLNRKGES